MKSVVLGILFVTASAGCAKPAESTPVPPRSIPIGMTRATVEPTPPTILVTAAPATKTFPTYAGDATWVRSLSRNKTFAVARDFERASDDPIELTWLVHPSVRIADAPPGDEYPGLYQAKLELVVRRGEISKTFDFGEHSGSPEGAGLTYCARKGYTRSGELGWSFGTERNVVSAFELSTMQGSEVVMLLLGSEGIHVLEQHQHDGACPVQVDQGPFKVCADMKWRLAFDIPLKGEPRVAETAYHVDEQAVRTPVDCKASYSGETLVDP